MGLSYNSASVNEDEFSPALNLTATTPDTDGSETLEVLVSGLASGATITDGANTFTASAGNTSVDIASWDLTQLQYRASQNSDADANLTITLTTTEPNGDSQSVFDTLSFTVNAVADAPNLAVTDSSSGRNLPLDLGLLIDVSLADTDGSESISNITIASIPVGAQILDNGIPLTITGGSVTLTQAQLANLTFVPPNDFVGTLTLDVSATSTESSPENGVAQLSATAGPLQLNLTFDLLDDLVTSRDDVGIVASQQSVTLNVVDNDLVPDG